jgi:hypothetical protein
VLPLALFTVEEGGGDGGGGHTAPRRLRSGGGGEEVVMACACICCCRGGGGGGGAICWRETSVKIPKKKKGGRTSGLVDGASSPATLVVRSSVLQRHLRL